jgi:hypothetical protein
MFCQAFTYEVALEGFAPSTFSAEAAVPAGRGCDPTGEM